MGMGMEPGTSDSMMMGGMEMEEGMGMGGRRGGRRGRRRRPQRPGMGEGGMMQPGGRGGMMAPGMGGCMMGGMMGGPGMGGGEMMGEGTSGLDPYDLIPLTRRDLRVFDAQKDVTMT